MMGLYDMVVNSFKERKKKIEKDPIRNESVSSVLVAELTLISTLLLAAISLRHFSPALAIIVILGLALLLFTNLPIMPKIKIEQDDSLDKMTFYIILTLGILITVICWGNGFV